MHNKRHLLTLLIFFSSLVSYAQNNINLSVSSNIASEASATVITVTATASSTVSGNQTVDIATTGAGIEASDFLLSNTVISIPDGAITASVTLTVQNDIIHEGDEIAILTISNPSAGIAIGATASQSITISDDDSPPSVTLDLSGSPLAENGGIAYAIAELSTVSGLATTVNLTFSGNATGGGADYTAASSITIGAGNSKDSISITGNNDNDVEGNETVIVDIDTVINGTEAGTQQVTAIISDDDGFVGTRLNIGEIAIIGVNTGSDDFTFVLLANIVAGTEIIFTDREPTASGSDTLNAGEGQITYTAPSNMSGGTVIDHANNSADFSGNLALANTGDNIIALQGYNPTTRLVISFLHGVNTEGGQLTILPQGLSTDDTISIGADDGEYIGDRVSSDLANLYVLINDANNWLVTNSFTANLNTNPFIRNDVPVLANLEEDIIAYTENDTATNITNAITVGDDDGGVIDTATIEISTAYQIGEDSLIFTNQNGITGSFDNSNGILSLSGNTTLTNYQTALRSITYLNSSENPNTATRVITFTVNDGISNSNQLTRNIGITSINDAPLFFLNTNTITVDEDFTSTQTITLTDNSPSDEASQTITYALSPNSVTFANINFNSNTGKVDISQVNDSSGTQIFTITATDDGIDLISGNNDDSTATQTFALTINPVNDAPIVRFPASPTIIEDNEISFNNISITDEDLDDQQIMMTIINGVVTFSTTTGLSFLVGDGTKDGFFAFSGTLNNVNTALNRMVFSPTPNFNGTSIIRIETDDNNEASDDETLNISVLSENDAPILADIEPTALDYTSCTTSIIITNLINISDVDSDTLSGASITISDNYDRSQDTLVFTNTATIRGNWNNTNGILTLSGNDTLPNYVNALRSVNYIHTKPLGVDSTRQIAIEFKTDDASLTSSSLTRDIVLNNITPTVDAGSNRAICSGESVTLGGSPTVINGGDVPYTYIWEEIVDGGVNNLGLSGSNPIITPPESTSTKIYTYTLTLVNKDKCVSATDTVIITVNPLPNVDIIAEIVVFAAHGDNVQLNANPGPTESGTGVFSGPGVVSNGDNSIYFFNPQIAGTTLTRSINTPHQITYTYTDSVNNCTNTETVEFSVFDDVNPIDGLMTAYCASGDSTYSTFTADSTELLLPVGSNSNGIANLINPNFSFHSYSGTGVREVDGKFYFVPRIITFSPSITSRTINVIANQVNDADPTDIREITRQATVVNKLPNVSIQNLTENNSIGLENGGNIEYCTSDENIYLLNKGFPVNNLTNNTDTGQFDLYSVSAAGTLLSSNLDTLKPAALEVGSYILSYTHQNANNCQDSVTQPIIIRPLPAAPTIAFEDTIICVDNLITQKDVPTLVADTLRAGDPNTTINWYDGMTNLIAGSPSQVGSIGNHTFIPNVSTLNFGDNIIYVTQNHFTRCETDAADADSIKITFYDIPATPSFDMFDITQNSVTTSNEYCQGEELPSFRITNKGAGVNGNPDAEDFEVGWSLNTNNLFAIIADSINAVNLGINTNIAGSYTIYVTQRLQAACPSPTAEITLTIHQVPEISIFTENEYGVDSVTYCVSDSTGIIIRANIVDEEDRPLTGAGTWSGTGITNSSSLGATFNPSIAAASVSNDTAQTFHKLIYNFTSSDGCSATDSITFEVNPLPKPNFSISSGCFERAVQFQDASTIVKTDSIVAWEWIFENQIPGMPDDTAKIQNPTNVFKGNPGSYDVTLKVWTKKRCSNTITRKIAVESIPEVDFVWKNICQGQQTIFTSTSSLNLGQVDSYRWDFGDGNTAKLEGTTINHEYAQPGLYQVTLTATLKNNCTSSITQNVYILPSITVTPSNPYKENFEDGIAFELHGWYAAGNDSITWELGSLKGAAADVGITNTNAWATNLDGKYKNNDRSFVFSPCFDLRALGKPSITMNLWYSTDVEEDGLIIQYSADNGENWQTLGKIKDGLNWYNGTVSSNQGSFPIGWSGEDTTWRRISRFLDDLPTQDNILFRVAFSANGDGTKAGIAFDNIIIEERKKIVLLEHFTNTTDSIQDPVNNSRFSNIINNVRSDALAINYFTNIPSPGPLNEQNPRDPSARSLYYGIDRTQQVFVSGDEMVSISSLDSSHILHSTLEPLLFDLTLTLPTEQGENMAIDVDISYVQDSAINRELILHLSLVERVVNLESSLPGGINTAEWVLREMIPSAAGFQLQEKAWSLSKTMQRISIPWNGLPNNITDYKNLILIAFLQNNNTKEIYQTVSKVPTIFPEVVTALEDKLSKVVGTISIYPNPANEWISVYFEKASQKNIIWKIFNSLGQFQKDGIILPSQTAQISTKDLADGLYFIRFDQGFNTSIYFRFIIEH